MYDKEYAQIWIDNYESKKDSYRVDFLEPYLKKIIHSLPGKTKILDIGCGWGLVVSFLKPTHIYHGVDVTTAFFPYIEKRFKNPNVSLAYGALPKDVDVKDNSFDFVVCSLTIHALPHLAESIKTVFSKTKSKGRVLIVDFNDGAEKELRKAFDPVEEENDKYIRGSITLPSGMNVTAEVNFYKEKDYENEITKYSSYKKIKVGPLFMAYDCIKN